MSRVCLVACAKKKQESKEPAEDLYDSTLFNLARRYAELHSDTWFILSAKYGLLSPKEIIEPYDLTLKDLSRAERRDWAARVENQLRKVLKPGDSVVMLAGVLYRQDLVPLLELRGLKTIIPLKGLSIGRQQKRLIDLNSGDIHE